ncbi:MAG: penicillin-binding protein activator [Gammaproteobacteria bacterium]|nr:penicillin-binding protein activator [Gammaproteobacteria bacterium]
MICSRAPFSLPALLLCLLAAISLAACGPVERAPIANAERAAALAERGEHAAAASEYESLAASAPGGGANTWRLAAIEQWLLAERIEPAAQGLALLDAPLDAPLEVPLDVGQSFERDRLTVLFLWLRDGAAKAWQRCSALTAPDAVTQAAARARFFELRQRLALANALPVEAVRSALERERLTDDPRAAAAVRTVLLADLRAAVDTGLRIDPRLAGRDALVRGWLEAASLAARAARLPASGNAAITAAWQRRYPNHPARTALVETHLEAPPPMALAATPTDAPRDGASGRIAAESARLDSAHIAVLLPLSGRLAAAGREVRDGLIAAHFAHGGDGLALRFYDTATATDPVTMQALIAQARTAGAGFLIGPLGRDEVVMAANLPNSLPQLLLNTLPASTAPRATSLWQYALLAEEEAKLAAERALAVNQRRAIILLPTGDWAARVGTAFRSTFEAGGGRVLAQESLADDSSAAIEKALRLEQSRARHRRLQSIVDETLVFQPRRRGDVDLLFSPGTAQQIRQLRPQLKFHGAADIPTYATADAWDGNRSSELEGLLFADMPWMLSPATGAASRLATQLESAGDEPRRHGRLFAFGYDAWLLQAAMQQRLATGTTESSLRIDGVTGILSIGADGIIQRELTLAHIDAGVAAAVTP